MAIVLALASSFACGCADFTRAQQAGVALTLGGIAAEAGG